MSRSRRRNLIRCIAAGFTVLSAVWMLGMLGASSASASPLNPSDEPNVAPSSRPVIPEKTDVSYVGLTIKQLAKQGYAIDGPSQVLEMKGNTLVIFTGQKKNWTVNLGGKKVTVADANGNPLTLNNIEPKSKIYMARSRTEVKIFVLPKKEGGNES